MRAADEDDVLRSMVSHPSDLQSLTSGLHDSEILVKVLMHCHDQLNSTACRVLLCCLKAQTAK